ncbi:MULTISPECIES: ABC transporter permease [Pontibacillus]|uniref:ABC transporter permease n=1 Tax=Pontibacillus chungwhensis TaxID=265426 RepID=A0ABY8UZL9_9BACI|nr:MULTISPECIES: ABC transporter permease [Pontibacillus]MCD5324971.1 ABC transporter permease [Pontibacillus sp. HN14]WIF98929.1 ABC transporter permease [Pontibacillus chungwhensis]
MLKIEPQKLWRGRLDSHTKEMGRYLRLMFNDHFSFAMFFFLAGMTYNYQQWLATLDAGFPTALVMGVVFAALLTYSPIRTFLREADLVFLLPAEHRLSSFFRSGIVYSFCLQVFGLFFVVVAFGPLYFTTYSDREISAFVLFGIVILILKAWNTLSHWWELNSRVGWSGYVDPVLRFLLNGLTIYFFVQGNWIFAGVTTILLFGLMMYDYSLAKKRKGIAWDVLIQKDQQRMQVFYRIANMFTDVPHLKNSVKKRHWLVRLIKNPIPFKSDKTFDYLYRITFIRSSDYLGLYIRLLLIAGAFVYFVPNVWMKLAFGFLFIYLSGFQMVTLWQHHREVLWLDLYPLRIESRRKALTKWLFQLLIVKTALLGVIFLVLGNLLGLAIVWIGGALFSYYLSHMYLTKRLT